MVQKPNDVHEVHVEIYGRVQGVTFRHFVKTNADKLRLTGYVKNRDDGSVFVLAQGTREHLTELLDLVQKGPMFAKVDGVSYFWRLPEETYTDFVISVEKNVLSDQTSSFVNLGKKLLGVRPRVPVHIAIIPDGNRRWAASKGLAGIAGHTKAAQRENMNALLSTAQEMGIKYLTFWLFSTENWKRSNDEIKQLFALLEEACAYLKEEAVKNKIHFRHIGRKDRLPKNLVRALEELENTTKEYSEFHLQLCLDYGGRDEIIRAVNKMLKAGVQEVHDEDVARYLDSADIPDPDLIIRTSGEQRTSGFMPYQSTYAELYFCEKHFPEFGPDDLREAVASFGKRKRRFGAG